MVVTFASHKSVVGDTTVVVKLPPLPEFLNAAPTMVVPSGEQVTAVQGSVARLPQGATGWAKPGCIVLAQPGAIIHDATWRRGYSAPELSPGQVATLEAGAMVWGQSNSFLLVEPGAEIYLESGSLLFSR